MRELEFLPAWYPQLRRRKRLLIVQSWGSLVLVVGLGIWMGLARHNVRVQEDHLTLLTGGLLRTQSQLHQLDELLVLEKQRRQQVQVLEKLGGHVEAVRLLAGLEEAMPNDMALLSLSSQVEEQPRPPGRAGWIARAQGARRWSAERGSSCAGVAPTDVDVATFLARLGGMAYFEQVAMSYAKDLTQNGHLMREFEVTFTVSLGTID